MQKYSSWGCVKQEDLNKRFQPNIFVFAIPQMAEVFKMNETHPEFQSFSDIHTWVGYYKFITGIFNLYRLMHPIVPIT